tara:strand:+ start:189 stop:563 length:375 start_codon:yes stop_codon:yes gene_type:complete
MNWYLKCFKQYSDFSGRARRTEFWMFNLFTLIVAFICVFCDIFLGFDIMTDPEFFNGPITNIYLLASLLPGLSVIVRRLHDVGKSGWMYFLVLIPIIGPIWVFVLLVTDSQPGENKWGPNPKAK